jgi:hypothetical protein
MESQQFAFGSILFWKIPVKAGKQLWARPPLNGNKSLKRQLFFKGGTKGGFEHNLYRPKKC